jgi:hypothetical protein
MACQGPHWVHSGSLWFITHPFNETLAVERGLRGVVKDVDIIRKIFVGGVVGIVVRALRAGQVTRIWELGHLIIAYIETGRLLFLA